MRTCNREKKGKEKEKEKKEKKEKESFDVDRHNKFWTTKRSFREERKKGERDLEGKLKGRKMVWGKGGQTADEGENWSNGGSMGVCRPKPEVNYKLLVL